MADNAKVLDNGFAKGLEMIQDHLVNSLIQSVKQLLDELPRKKGYFGFTGQTQTSYMGGVYVNGSLRYIIGQQVWTIRPRRGKIPKGKTAFLKNPYEGEERAVIGAVDISNPSGRQTSINFLQGYKAQAKGLTVVITTGTEYSEFIETIKGMDVLSRTRYDAPKVLNSNWKPIP